MIELLHKGFGFGIMGFAALLGFMSMVIVLSLIFWLLGITKHGRFKK